MAYDDQNIFAKILRGDIPCNKIYEDNNEEIAGLIKGISIVAKKLEISTENGKGYRALANISEDGGQEVPHLHFHIFGGEKIGKMVS